MSDSPDSLRDDAVRLVAAVIARGPESELAQEIAQEAVDTHPPADFAVDVADIASTSLQALAESAGDDRETLLHELSDRRALHAD
ncbi:hypothetical protein [Naasia sp. SYSU D00057]|uniref:hypothetical protein n=1 Tax=Naasia sp. SYSU D00057 TaxID=2817380 RepID=UPI001B30A480|nr:hypothetical protein [Naasia sp. SYSU D00057]